MQTNPWRPAARWRRELQQLALRSSGWFRASFLRRSAFTFLCPVLFLCIISFLNRPCEKRNRFVAASCVHLPSSKVSKIRNLKSSDFAFISNSFQRPLKLLIVLFEMIYLYQKNHRAFLTAMQQPWQV